MINGIDGKALEQLGLGRTEAAGPKDRLGQEDFMRLMITQLRNQDPFAPMESGEFLGQLAQFGTVSGIEGLQSSFQQLAGAMAGSQALQAAGLVDRQVLVPAREGWLAPDATLRGGVDLPPGTTDAAIGVYDLSGRLVTTLPLDAGAGGRAMFEWDGALPDGSRAAPGFYELRAAGTAAGRSAALDLLVAGRVESVSFGGGGAMSLTVTGLGVVDFDRVRGIG